MRYANLPEYHFLKKVSWQLFVGLSFRETISEGPRWRLAFAFNRGVAKSHHIHFSKLLWCLREEGSDADRAKRPHFHLTIAGIPRNATNEENCRELQVLWRRLGGGLSDIRVYNPLLDGIGYILKSSGEELRDSKRDSSTFQNPSKLMFSKSVVAWLKRRQ